MHVTSNMMQGPERNKKSIDRSVAGEIKRRGDRIKYVDFDAKEAIDNANDIDLAQH